MGGAKTRASTKPPQPQHPGHLKSPFLPRLSLFLSHFPLLPAMQTLSIAAAADLIARGLIVGIPTETVYGLAADAQCDRAIAQVYATKGRPADHPLIVHVASAAEVVHFADIHAPHFPAWAHALMAAFWPGPLTLIVPRRAGVGEKAAAGQSSIGIRCPAHPVAQALLSTCLQLPQPVRGLAAPSANRFGRISPTTAAHVWQDFGGTVPVLDGGACAVGIESTIIDATRGVPVLLRPGAITPEQITAVCGQRVLLPHEATQHLPPSAAAPKASGTLAAHYAPRAPVVLFDTPQDLLQWLPAQPQPVWIYHRADWVNALRAVLEPTPRTGHLRVFGHLMPSSAEAAAQTLFADLRHMDAAGAATIAVQRPATNAAWAGVCDRLQRAAAAATQPISATP